MVPVECGSEGSFPLQNACSQRPVHRGILCAHTAVHQALVRQVCVDAANWKGKLT